jgi:hypothetical protein
MFSKKRFPFLVVFLGMLILASSVWGAVILDQPLSTTNTFAYYNQEYVPGAPNENDVYIADDFVLDKAQRISTVYVPGDFRWPGWGDLSTLLCADYLHLEIYTDANGKPSGHPRDSVNLPIVNIALPPNDAQVVLTDGTRGYPTNVTLNLASPIYLNPGTYWLVFYPEMEWATCGGYGRQLAAADAADNYSPAQAIKPLDTFTWYPTTWTNVLTIPWNKFDSPEMDHQDFAFRIEGDLVQQDIGVDPTTLNFGSVQVANTKVLEVAISSRGTGNLGITDIGISGSSTFTVDATGGSNPCGSTSLTLAAGDSCTVEVAFTPTNLVNQTASLDITSNDPDTATMQVPLSGIGVTLTTPDIAVDPDTHNFGVTAIGVPVSQVFTITNNGNANLVITDIGFSGDSAGMFAVVTGGGDPCLSLTPTIAAGGSCTINVTYTPTTGGSHSAFLDISSNDPDFATFPTNLSGTGLYDVTISTLEGTIGTEITFSESPSGFGIKKGKILIQQAAVNKANLKIARGGWLNDTVTGTMNKALPAGVYDMKIMLQPFRTATPINLPGAFTFKKPQITSLNRYSAPPLTDVGITGKFFGSKKPKVYLEYKDSKGVDKKKNCPVKTSIMDAKTGDSTIGFTVPRGLPEAAYQLRVETKKVGVSEEVVMFTITPSDF